MSQNNVSTMPQFNTLNEALSPPPVRKATLPKESHLKPNHPDKFECTAKPRRSSESTTNQSIAQQPADKTPLILTGLALFASTGALVCSAIPLFKKGEKPPENLEKTIAEATEKGIKTGLEQLEAKLQALENKLPPDVTAKLEALEQALNQGDPDAIRAEIAALRSSLPKPSQSESLSQSSSASSEAALASIAYNPNTTLNELNKLLGDNGIHSGYHSIAGLILQKRGLNPNIKGFNLENELSKVLDQKIHNICNKELEKQSIIKAKVIALLLLNKPTEEELGVTLTGLGLSQQRTGIQEALLTSAKAIHQLDSSDGNKLYLVADTLTDLITSVKNAESLSSAVMLRSD